MFVERAPGQDMDIPDICHKYHKLDMWRKIFHVEKFQIYMHDRCGKIWNFSTCGVISNFSTLWRCGEIWHFSTCWVISNFSTWQMWRNLKFLHIWHVYDVENVFSCTRYVVCWQIGLSWFTLFSWKICFVAIYTLLCGEKLNQILRMWRKNDKYEVWILSLMKGSGLSVLARWNVRSF